MRVYESVGGGEVGTWELSCHAPQVECPAAEAINTNNFYPPSQNKFIPICCSQPAPSQAELYFPTLTTHTCRYAMREALAIVGEEGLEPMWARHKELHLQV